MGKWIQTKQGEALHLETARFVRVVGERVLVEFGSDEVAEFTGDAAKAIARAVRLKFGKAARREPRPPTLGELAQKARRR